MMGQARNVREENSPTLKYSNQWTAMDQEWTLKLNTALSLNSLTSTSTTHESLPWDALTLGSVFLLDLRNRRQPQASRYPVSHPTTTPPPSPVQVSAPATTPPAPHHSPQHHTKRFACTPSCTHPRHAANASKQHACRAEVADRTLSESQHCFHTMGFSVHAGRLAISSITNCVTGNPHAW